MSANDSWDGLDYINNVVFASVNITLSIPSMLMNFIFVFCMVFPQQGIEQLKQPLNVLLGSLVGGNIALHVFTLLAVFFDLMSSSNALIYNITAAVMLYTMRISITSTLWLNVFYYCQIVPAQLSVFIWLKKNIRVFIYSALVVDRIFFLYGFTVAVVSLIKNGNCPANEVVNTKQNTTNLNKTLSIRLFFLSPSLFLMLALSCVTVFFLWRHMKNMKKSNGSSFSRRQRQIRVSIISISVQALLYITCSTLFTVDEIIFIVSSSFFDLKNNIYKYSNIYLYC
uniref:Taste receptor type 2 n=1 Tax=Astyanax mexicanus TaxID=7994 RepID=A0A8B9RPI8_ASTMX